MLYHSTRSEAHFVDSAEAVLEGLAPDGGLYMPESIPAFDWQACLRGSSTEMSAKILAALLPDIPDMDTLVRRAYQGKFETEDLTPTVSVGGYSVLELFRGPTSAFKDVALSMLPQLLTAAKAVKGMEKDILILTATSGDTGKAALEGFRDVPGVRICVFYPDGGVSQVQRAQMVTQEGSNVAVSAVRGNFDDAQTGVKNIFAACQGRELPYALSSANSINIGRLAPQIMYYFRSYRDLLDAGKIKLGDEVNYSVPTGNFGDILAGYLAKRLGLPVGKLICASNANNVLTDFIRTGVYDKRRPLLKTTSPSMDILVSSNLERLLYLLSGDTALVSGLMNSLNREGVYTVPGALLATNPEGILGCLLRRRQSAGDHGPGLPGLGLSVRPPHRFRLGSGGGIRLPDRRQSSHGGAVHRVSLQVPRGGSRCRGRRYLRQRVRPDGAAVRHDGRAHPEESGGPAGQARAPHRRHQQGRHAGLRPASVSRQEKLHETSYHPRSRHHREPRPRV